MEDINNLEYSQRFIYSARKIHISPLLNGSDIWRTSLLGFQPFLEDLQLVGNYIKDLMKDVNNPEYF